MQTVPLEYGFETLVRGGENVLAISGALEVLREPGDRYNPLLVVGATGVGKTHLLYALRSRLEAVHPSWNVLALPAGEFIADCEESLRKRQLPEFRQQLWRLDALLLDDIHLLGGHRTTLDELYHTFNRMMADGKQLVFTSAYPPAELLDFPVTLRNRLQSGLVVALEVPGEQLLREVFTQKCRQAGLRPTGRAITLLARETRSFRDVEGIVHQLEQRYPHRQITVAEVRELLEQSGLSLRHTRVLDVAKATCQHYQIKLEDIRSASRQHPFIEARQVAMYLARELTQTPLSEIGAFFGGRDHSTVLHACRRIAEELPKTPSLARAARAIRSLVGG